jgi:hypothetical protein
MSDEALTVNSLPPASSPRRTHDHSMRRHAVNRETHMSDDKTKSGGQDRTRINLSEAYEVRDWAKKFGVSKEELTAAVKKVGSKASEVEAHLKSTAK